MVKKESYRNVLQMNWSELWQEHTDLSRIKPDERTKRQEKRMKALLRQITALDITKLDLPERMREKERLEKIIADGGEHRPEERARLWEIVRYQKDIEKFGVRCPTCNQHMKLAKGCTYPAFQFGETSKPGTVVVNRIPYEGGWSPFGPGGAREGEGEDRCNDCGCQVGGIHHDGCDVERCPRCGGQSIGCACFEEFDDKVFVVRYAKKEAS